MLSQPQEKEEEEEEEEVEGGAAEEEEVEGGTNGEGETRTWVNCCTHCIVLISFSLLFQAEMAGEILP